jgi:hypothetical protein
MNVLRELLKSMFSWKKSTTETFHETSYSEPFIVFAKHLKEFTKNVIGKPVDFAIAGLNESLSPEQVHAHEQYWEWDKEIDEAILRLTDSIETIRQALDDGLILEDINHNQFVFDTNGATHAAEYAWEASKIPSFSQWKKRLEAIVLSYSSALTKYTSALVMYNGRHGTNMKKPNALALK